MTRIYDEADKDLHNLRLSEEKRRKRKISEELIEEMDENQDVRIEHYLNSKKRKAYSLKIIRKFRQRVRAREMLDSLEISDDSEDET